MNRNLGLYFHIPFCRKKCAYCDFCSTANWDDARMDAYLEALIRQMDDFFISGGRYEADTVYIGGGTPSVFGGKRIARLLREVGKRVRLAHGAEITVEVNPESADQALFRQLKRAGVNRISMGVQSADDAMLARIGRVHDFATAKEAVALCKKYCTENLSLDLMYGLPGQTMEGWMESLNAVCALEPRHISCYALKLEEGTPMFSENPDRPDEDLQADMYLAAVKRLEELGFQQYEISNFARPGFFSRHNSKYWDLAEYLGFGAAAHSFYNGKRFFYTSDLEAYLSGMEGKNAIVEDTDELPFYDRVGEYVMLALRTAAGIDENTFYTRFHRDFAPIGAKLEQYIPSGHVLRENSRWRLTPKGFLVSNVIIGEALDACPSR